MDIIIEALKENCLFNNMDDDDIKKSLSEITYYIKEYNKGEIIAHEQEECSVLGLVIDGEIAIERIYSNGKSIMLQKFSKGAVFGEALVFSSIGNYPATVEATKNTKILFIKKEEVLKLCLQYQDVFENFMILLSDKVFLLNEKIKNISFKSLKQRVINYILQRSKKQKSLKIKLNENRETLAAYLSMPRPSLSRELMNLRDEGFIDYDKTSITILDIEGLEEELFN